MNWFTVGFGFIPLQYGVRSCVPISMVTTTLPISPISLHLYVMSETPAVSWDMTQSFRLEKHRLIEDDYTL